MNTSLNLARDEDIDRLIPLILAARQEQGRECDLAMLRHALAPLLAGGAPGALYLFGPARAPIGYILISFGWSLDTGGVTGRVEELWIRPPVRRRGIGTEVLHALPKALAQAGMTAVEAEVPEDPGLLRLFRGRGFTLREGTRVMSLRM